MKLKYYLRGMGLGVLLTAIIMGVALGGSGKKVSDAEVRQRAKQLGMVEAESTLSEYSEAAKSSEEEANANATSDQAMDKKGEEETEKVDEGISTSGESVSEVASKEKENASLGKSSESVEAEADIAMAEKSSENAASTDSIFSEKPAEVSNEVKEEKTEEKPEETLEAADNNKVEATVAEKTEEKQEEKQEEIKEEKPVENQEAQAVEGEAPVREQTEVASSETPELSYTVVVLPSGSGSDRCAVVLRDAGIVDDALAFNKYLVDRGIDRKIRSGTKQIPKGSSYEEIAAIITR
ncbi:MAG: hypothetical protein K6G06_02160 [Butyrivibrio sp.]|nr:hypothetical protein [Butyrivibrio sp.]